MYFFFQAEDGIRDADVTGVQTCALPISGELTCSAAQVAGWLNVSKPTVIAAARRGELPGRQVGKQWRFSTKALAKMWGLDQMLDQVDRSSTTLIEVPAALVNALRLRSTGGDAA